MGYTMKIYASLLFLVVSVKITKSDDNLKDYINMVEKKLDLGEAIVHAKEKSMYESLVRDGFIPATPTPTLANARKLSYLQMTSSEDLDEMMNMQKQLLNADISREFRFKEKAGLTRRYPPSHEYFRFKASNSNEDEDMLDLSENIESR